MTSRALASLLRKEFVKRTFDFERLARTVFLYQYERNAFFRSWCDANGKNPSNVKKIDDIPFVPIDMFKHKRLACFPFEETVKIFNSSGTSGGRHSEQYLDEYANALQEDIAAKQFFDIVPEFKSGNFTLAAFIRVHPQMFGSTGMCSFFGVLAKYAREHYFASGMFTINDEGTLIFAAELLARLAKERTRPVLLGMNHDDLALLCLYYKKHGIHVRLPRGSIIYSAGGIKKAPLTVKETWRLALKTFGLSSRSVVDCFSGTETNGKAMSRGFLNYTVPAWWHVRILDAHTLDELPSGKRGLIQMTDLLNFNSLSFLLLPMESALRKGSLTQIIRNASPAYKKIVEKCMSTDDGSRLPLASKR